MYIILAILGIGFLIFIHELAHFFVARWVGMRVEAFGIGFGKPFYSWEHDGVKWNLCWLFFGGYVKIAGMEKEGNVEPYEVSDGYFGKGPWARIKVAIAGPLANIILGFAFFGILWLSGGREKPFSEFTHTIGWVDPNSELYAFGIRPGDEIVAYDGQPYQTSKDLIYAPLLAEGKIRVQGNKVDYQSGQRTPFDFLVNVYENPVYLDDGVMTSGILASGNYVLYQRFGDKDNPLPEGSPMMGSGIQYGDRIYWVDGERIFSSQHLAHILNDNRALVTIKRGNDILLARVPRVPIEELKLDAEHREELSDWQHQMGLSSSKLSKLIFIPYNLDSEGVVEGELRFIDKDNHLKAFPDHPLSEREMPLRSGDKIIAIDGTPVSRSVDIFQNLQEHHVNVIVERNSPALVPILWTQADKQFVESDQQADLGNLVSTIGTNDATRTSGHFVLLKQIVPKPWSAFVLSKEKQALLNSEIIEQRKEIEKIDNTEKRQRALTLFEERNHQLVLGIAPQDRQVTYNPGAIQQLKDVVNEIWRTLSALILGDLNPKWLAGPVGMVQILQNRWGVSIKEAIFWLGAISINLGVLNLLPIPVLDGGHICMALFEIVTGRRLKAKTVERLIIPFTVLLIGFMVFVTFHDLVRLFGRLLG